MSLHLYELTEKFKSLEQLATSDEIPEEIIRDTLDGLESDWKEKAIAVAAFVRNLEASAENINEAALLMHNRSQRLKARAASLKAYLQFHFVAMNQKKIECEMFTIRLADNPPAVVVDDEALIHDLYKIQPETPPKRLDRAAIAKAIKAGEVVPGAHTEKGQSLRIES